MVLGQKINVGATKDIWRIQLEVCQEVLKLKGQDTALRLRNDSFTQKIAALLRC